MAMLYITDETRAKLDFLREKEHRGISDEINFLVDQQLIELGFKAPFFEPKPKRENTNVG